MVMRASKSKCSSRITATAISATIVLPEGENSKILRAAHIMREEGIAEPILLGNARTHPAKSCAKTASRSISRVCRSSGPARAPSATSTRRRFSRSAQRKGATFALARGFMKQNNYYGAMMVETGEADGMLSGFRQSYPETIRPALQCMGVASGLAPCRHLHDGLQKARALVCRHDGQYRSHSGRAGRHRDSDRAHRSQLHDRRAARGDAFVLELRIQQSSASFQGPRSRRDHQET